MEITAKQLKEKIKNGDKLIIDFYAKWCQPCRMMKPYFEKLSEQMKNDNSPVELYTFDVESDKDFSVELGIRSVPTIKSFINGGEVYTKPGIHSESQIKQLSNQLLNG